ncbi:MarR family winged helix-turn-helix transcriptional regulator [Actinomadura hibisca]|uniref:MarR family winged helix-turn-helix transcriptional regulator n=1 Tax=Actinomadura hibisca TaxID=68565 RepID=UPI00082FBCC6|nr:MarR family transcriptional regulator [Actinomadura hibisca]
MDSPTPDSVPADELLRLDRQVCFAVHGAARAFDAVYRPLLRELGLTYPQYLVMLALWEHGTLTVKELGLALRLDSGTLSPLLKRLEGAGFVRRERDRRDERSVTVSPTAAGERLREHALGVPREILAATGMDGEGLAEMRASLARLTAALDAVAPGGR